MQFKTQNLVIRPVTREDVQEVARMWNFEKGEIAQEEAIKAIKWMEQNHRANEQARERLINPKTRLPPIGHACFAIFEDHSNRIIGWCGLDGRSGDQVNIFYLIDKAFRRQGYATLCAQKMLDYGFTSMHMDRIDGECASDNIGSRKILERIGMTIITDASESPTREDSFHYYITQSDFNDKYRA